jgi:3-keto-5-aminohexanoate cleavage enzyme
LEPLIITSNDPMIPAGSEQVGQTIEEGVAAAGAGAAILHHHLIYRPLEPGRSPELDVDASVEVISRIRERTDAIIQLGITTATNESRMEVAERAGVEMFSITLSDNDHYVGQFPPVRRDRAEMEMLATFCLENKIVPEWEVFHAGAVWNLHYLISRGLARAPYWVNLCLYHEGSCWSPRTAAEVDYRASLLPAGSKWHLAAFARPQKDYVVAPITPDEHTRLLAHAVLAGGHVRTGKEDRPERTKGVPARTNAELVGMVAELATALERRIATPNETRALLEMSPAPASAET